MFKRKTAFVLGVGILAQYGFPAGGELVDAIAGIRGSEELQHQYQWMAELLSDRGLPVYVKTPLAHFASVHSAKFTAAR